jgi:hypothetical protein
MLTGLFHHVSSESTATPEASETPTTVAPTTTTMSEAEKVPTDRATIKANDGVMYMKSNGIEVVQLFRTSKKL